MIFRLSLLQRVKTKKYRQNGFVDISKSNVF